MRIRSIVCKMHNLNKILYNIEMMMLTIYQSLYKFILPSVRTLEVQLCKNCCKQ